MTGGTCSIPDASGPENFGIIREGRIQRSHKPQGLGGREKVRTPKSGGDLIDKKALSSLHEKPVLCSRGKPALFTAEEREGCEKRSGVV